MGKKARRHLLFINATAAFSAQTVTNDHGGSRLAPRLSLPWWSLSMVACQAKTSRQIFAPDHLSRARARCRSWSPGAGVAHTPADFARPSGFIFLAQFLLKTRPLLAVTAQTFHHAFHPVVGSQQNELHTGHTKVSTISHMGQITDR